MFDSGGMPGECPGCLDLSTNPRQCEDVHSKERIGAALGSGSRLGRCIRGQEAR